jgi:phosphatidylserine decarboxylase
MLKQLLCYFQYILPKHLISVLMGKLANTSTPWLKNTFIDYFSRAYGITLDEAVVQNPHDFQTFNAFFTRALKPDARPIDATPNTLVSPADGKIAQLGRIQQQQLIQAKGMYFNLSTLLGGQDETAALFADGHFATIYLAPNNYHRVHMPASGTLIQSIYIPGNLFSVNRMTSQLIPNLYARNERLVLIFATEKGPMAVILVGALIVGSMQTVWMDKPIRSNKIELMKPSQPIKLEKGAELGRFLLGSTVIVLLPAGSITWAETAKPDATVLTGQSLASLKQA